MVKKVLIVFQRMTGQPDYIRVSEILEGGRLTNPGTTYNLKDLPGVPEEPVFEMEFSGDFEIQYKWKDYRNHWHRCDEGKFKWCLGKNIRAERIYTYTGKAG